METNGLYQKRTECCGCEICAFSCKTGSLFIQEDEEGFRYPKIDTSKCIDCGQCIAACPMRKTTDIKSMWLGSYSGWSTSKEVHSTSSSGGFASELAQCFIEHGGVVYGVAYDERFENAIYIRCNDFNSLHKLRSSKYIQAKKNEIYSDILKDLKSNVSVLFIGTPCDSAAVRLKFGKYSNLFIVSLICHGPTSNEVQKLFITKLEQTYKSKIKSFNIRYKKDGQWKPYYIEAQFYNGDTYLAPFSYSEYDNAFRHFKRPSCTSCPFKNDKYAGDLLIGDFHSARRNTAEYHDMGVSTVLVTSERGFQLLGILDTSFDLHKADLTRSTEQLAVHSSYKMSPIRDQFSLKLREEGLTEASNIYYIKMDNKMIELRKTVMKCGSKLKHLIIK